MHKISRRVLSILSQHYSLEAFVFLPKPVHVEKHYLKCIIPPIWLSFVPLINRSLLGMKKSSDSWHTYARMWFMKNTPCSKYVLVSKAHNSVSFGDKRTNYMSLDSSRCDDSNGMQNKAARFQLAKLRAFKQRAANLQFSTHCLKFKPTVCFENNRGFMNASNKAANLFVS